MLLELWLRVRVRGEVTVCSWRLRLAGELQRVLGRLLSEVSPESEGVETKFDWDLLPHPQVRFNGLGGSL